MRRLNLRKHCYILLWFFLALAVGAVWLLGGRQAEQALPPFLPDLQAGAAAGGKFQLEAEDMAQEKELAGVWVPYMSLDTADHTQKAFEENFQSIAREAKEMGLNALFVHVRPFSDALYPSALFPWSHLLTGEQGKNPGFDPLAFMVDCAHSLGLEFHAWINPLRVKTAETPKALAANNPYSVLQADCPYYFMEWEGGVYLDPAYPYVRSLIADGAAEIAEKYEVDGIHFDDYFYPAEDASLDSEAYALYMETVETPLPLLEWRRANISALVAEVYAKVKKARPQAVFGISPQGNIENDENMGADVQAWCASPGYVDYICPQLYYSFENEALGYAEALAQWQALPRHENLALYAGLALYKAGTDADGGTWLLSDDIIRRQIEAARASQCSGVVLYSSQYLHTEQTQAEVANLPFWENTEKEKP